ncbi:MAG: GNAT family N-acetyltransferase [Candidatus Bathyarchaeia archaeon]
MKTDLAIRQAEPLDRAALKDIIDSSFPRFFRFFAAHSVDSKEGKVLVGEEDDAVLGFAKLTDVHVADRKYGCILWLAVHPNHRREGIASALVNAGVEELKRAGAGAVFASVLRRNKASLATFSGEGFKRVGFVGLWRLFGWRIFQFARRIWYAPGEVVVIHS